MLYELLLFFLLNVPFFLRAETIVHVQQPWPWLRLREPTRFDNCSSSSCSLSFSPLFFLFFFFSHGCAFFVVILRAHAARGLAQGNPLFYAYTKKDTRNSDMVVHTANRRVRTYIGWQGRGGRKGWG